MLKCGIHESDITPFLGRHLPGYFHERKGSGVLEPLCSEAVYFENENERVVLISNDIESMATRVMDEIREKIADELKIPTWCVLVCATHSHTAGPARCLPGCNEPGLFDQDYADFLIRRTVENAVMAAGDAREVKLSFAKGREERLGYCRIFRHKDGTLHTWEQGDGEPYTEIDHDVEVLYIDNADSSPYGMIVNYACHCDCLGGDMYCSDYPGVMRKELKNHYGMDLKPVFINSFCGNINHAAPDGHHQVQGYFRQMGKWLAEDVIQLRENALTGQEQKALAQPMIDARTANVTIPSRLPDEALVTWAEGIKQMVDQCGEAAVDEMSLHFYETVLNLHRDPVPTWTVPVQVIRIGQLAFYALPGEIFSEFALTLKERSPFPMVMPVNLANAHVEYVPVKEVFGYGADVYEARVGAGLLAPEGGYVMVEKLLELAEEMKEYAK